MSQACGPAVIGPVTDTSPKPDFASPPAADWLAQLDRDPPRYPYLLAGLWVLAVAFVDHRTGPVLSVAFLYLPAVVGLASVVGRKAGYGTAAAAALATLFANWPVAAGPQPALAAAWNAASTGALYAAVAYLSAEVRAHRDELRFVTHIDALTGLRNRAAFLVALDAELVRAERFGGHTSLLCIGVDGFRRVNDQAGRAAGDRLLKDIARQLDALVRRTDIVARTEADEFAVLLTLTDADSAQAVAQKVAESLNAWAVLESHPVSFTFGSASAPLGGGLSAEQLLARADATMYDRKRAVRESRPVAATPETAAA